MGTSKWTDVTRNSWTSKWEGLVRHDNDGAIAVMFAAMFLVGMALGGVLSTHESEPIQIASME